MGRERAEKKKGKKEERKRVDNKWRRVEEMRKMEERRAEKEWNRDIRKKVFCM